MNVRIDKTTGTCSRGVQDHGEAARGDDCRDVAGADRAWEIHPVHQEGTAFVQGAIVGAVAVLLAFGVSQCAL